MRKDPQNYITNSFLASHHMKPPVWLEVKQKAGGGQQTALRVQEEREQLRQKLEQQSHKRNQVPKIIKYKADCILQWELVSCVFIWPLEAPKYCILPNDNKHPFFFSNRGQVESSFGSIPRWDCQMLRVKPLVSKLNAFGCYCYVRDIRFVLLICLLTGFSFWHFFAP